MSFSTAVILTVIFCMFMGFVTGVIVTLEMMNIKRRREWLKSLKQK